LLLGILSDSHDQYDRTTRAVDVLRDRGAEAIIHCGDLTCPDLVYLCSELPAYFVLGNCDDDPRAIAVAVESTGGTWLNQGGIVELCGKRIAVTHGHLGDEVRRLEALGPDYLLSGHTHMMFDQRRNDLRLINPGALYRARRHTVALLDLANDRLDFLTII
jgi:putative phosphoesterase